MISRRGLRGQAKALLGSGPASSVNRESNVNQECHSLSWPRSARAGIGIRQQESSMNPESSVNQECHGRGVRGQAWALGSRRVV